MGRRESNSKTRVFEAGIKVWGRPEPIKPVVDGEDLEEEDDGEMWEDPTAQGGDVEPAPPEPVPVAPDPPAAPEPPPPAPEPEEVVAEADKIVIPTEEGLAPAAEAKPPPPKEEEEEEDEESSEDDGVIVNIGDRVKVKELEFIAGMNGKVGTVEGADAIRPGIWKVRLDETGKIVGLRK